MERCPCCNARLNGAILCPRCQSKLGGVIGSEKLAQLCLGHAMDFWFAYQPQLAIQSLSVALKFKRSTATLVFRDFIVKKQLQQVLTLLMGNKTTEANKMLCLLYELHPRNELLKQLRAFTDYLLAYKS